MTTKKENLYQYVKDNPQAREVLYDLGFHQVKEEKKFSILGKTISLDQALKMKKIDKAVFLEKLAEKKKKEESPDLLLQGVLPCPVRIPLTEGLQEVVDGAEEKGIKIAYDLKAASMGVDWLKEELLSQPFEALPDVFMSAGFDIFFEEALFGHYRKENRFSDQFGWSAYNKDFKDLADPKGQYGILGVVPAIFLINEEELEGREVPRSWADILKPEYERSVSLPIGDFDLFNAILLNIHKIYGDDGIDKLGKSLLKSMHPSQMVKSHQAKEEKPLVTIMPYFFSKMVFPGSPMKALWPEDGAIISPIFTLAKREKEKELEPLMAYFSSMRVAEILSHQGKFPSSHPDIDNKISADKTYLWLGWDFIESQDIGELLRHCEGRFNRQGGLS